MKNELKQLAKAYREADTYGMVPPDFEEYKYRGYSREGVIQVLIKFIEENIE